MASKARDAFDNNAKDIERLLALHKRKGGSNRGRRFGLEVLNKSAIVLMTAFWEAYCEDIASDGLAHLVQHAKSVDALPTELKKTVAKELKADPHELAIWSLSDDGRRKYLTKRFQDLKAARDKKLNTPKTQQIETLFHECIGIENISKNWHWAKKMTAKRAAEKLDSMVTLRGAIAHRGTHSSGVKKAQVLDYFDFIKQVVSKTGGAVNAHVRASTGKPLWQSQRLAVPPGTPGKGPQLVASEGRLPSDRQ